MFDVITIGGATRDIFFEISSLKVEKGHHGMEQDHLALPYGEKLVADKTFYSYGGGAINVAVCLARLGLKTAAVANLGHEGSGDMIVNYLKREKVNTSFIHRDKILHTGLTVLVLGKDGEHTGFLERGANDHLKLENHKALKKTKWFYVSSLTGAAEQILPEVFDLAKRYDIKVAFNPGSQQLLEGWGGLKPYIMQSEILLLNLEEAEKLVYSKTGHKPNSEKELLEQVREMGATISVVTEGELGSHVIYDGHIFHQGSFPKDVVDMTGAGDAFGATFLYGIFNNFDLKYCLKIASINSANVVSQMGSGTGLATYATIKKSKWL